MYTFRRILIGLQALIAGPQDKRQRVLHEIARIAANIFGGHYLGDNYKIWRTEERFLKKFRDLSPHNLFSEERKYTLKELAGSLKNVEGALAECGSYVGVSAWFVANELPGIDFYLFDSFEGLSEPTGFDLPPPGVQQWKKGDLQTTEALLNQNLAGFSNLHIMKGWIPHRFNEVEHIKFRLVHIDVDLYQPTLDSLEFFYERMSPGGIIVMDDYGFLNCPGAYKAANDFMKDKPERIIHLPTGQGIIIRRCDT